MDKIRVCGSDQPLQGEVAISGAKNAALPLMIMSILSDSPLTLRNVPDLSDVTALQNLLGELGVDVTYWGRNPYSSGTLGGRTVSLQTPDIATPCAPYELVRKMRASFWVLGPMLARCGQAKVSLPGGCAIGTRPVDLHLSGLRALGAEINVDSGYVIAKAPRGGLVGGRVKLRIPSVGATINIAAAASIARGETVIENAAREPEVMAVCECLATMGARIEGIGTSTVTIEGCEYLDGANFEVMPDRIEAGTYAVAAAITGGDLKLNGVRAQHLDAPINVLRQAGAEVVSDETSIRVVRRAPLQPVAIDTAPYPGFPTDLQAQFMALLAVAAGTSRIRETIFENRFMHVQELARLGADIRLDNDTAEITGVPQLTGAPVMATDLRASVSLVLAALVAKGETEIGRVYHLDRGFSRLEVNLSGCGAKIERISS